MKACNHVHNDSTPTQLSEDQESELFMTTPIGLSTYNLYFDVCHFYGSFGDTTADIYSRAPKLMKKSANLNYERSLSVRNYYENVMERDRTSFTRSTSLEQNFPSESSFHRYCLPYRLLGAIENGFARAVIKLTHCPSNMSGCLTCPLVLFRHLLSWTAGSSAIIPFNTSTNFDGERVYRIPWDTLIYETYAESVSWIVILVNLHSIGATLSKSGTQGATFLRVWFSNLRPYTEKWHTIDIAPTST